MFSRIMNRNDLTAIFISDSDGVGEIGENDFLFSESLDV